MQDTMRTHFPPESSVTYPEGGMFPWAELPAGLASMDLFRRAVEDKALFVPGGPFSVRGERHSTLRLNFSRADTETIATGIGRLSRAIHMLMDTASQALPADDG